MSKKSDARDARKASVVAHLKKHPAKTQTQIANSLGMDRSTITDYMLELVLDDEAKVVGRHEGSKLYSAGRGRFYTPSMIIQLPWKQLPDRMEA